MSTRVKQKKHRTNVGAARFPINKNSVRWSDLARGHDPSQARLETIDQLLAIVDGPEAAAIRELRPEIAERADILRRDRASYQTQLDAIAAQHAGRTDVCRNSDELMAVIQIGEEYQRWNDSFQSVVVPNTQFILDALRAPTA